MEEELCFIYIVCLENSVSEMKTKKAPRLGFEPRIPEGTGSLADAPEDEQEHDSRPAQYQVMRPRHSGKFAHSCLYSLLLGSF